MSDAPVLSVSGLSKKYCGSLRRALWYGMTDIVRELVPFGSPDAGLRAGEFWALEDLSFEVGEGESLAIVGPNGAGKSTLLKILYGLLKPDRGEVRVRGRVEALIELGTGFNPLLSGRENVHGGAAIHGLDARATGELLERVIDFAELGEFIDAPLQSYSAGMKARLSYALAAQLQPDVMLVDEVLAVGDLAFQRKCAMHMLDYLNGGGSLLLVSHNTYHIQSVCTRGILLDRGRAVFAGTAVETLHAMFERRLGGAAAEAEGAGSLRLRPGQAPPIGPVTIDEVCAIPAEGDAIRTREPLRIEVRYRADAPVDVLWGFSIWTADQWVRIAGENDMRRRTLDAGTGVLTCVIPRLPLLGGRYALRAAIVDYHTRQPLALYGWHDAAAVLEVRSSASLVSNAQLTMQQLVTIDVDWE